MFTLVAVIRVSRRKRRVAAHGARGWNKGDTRTTQFLSTLVDIQGAICDVSGKQFKVY